VETTSDTEPEINLVSRVQNIIKNTIGITMLVTLVKKRQIPRSEGGKLNRVLDLRKY